MLETGNSVDVVAKCLNHSSSKTTEQFYLKENIEEVTSRAVIPWLSRKQKKKPALPAFLDVGQKEKVDQPAKKRRMGDALAKLGML